MVLAFERRVLILVRVFDVLIVGIIGIEGYHVLGVFLQG
jgi:hypothetical protein